MSESKVPPNSLQLVDANTMRAELAKITPIDTSTLVDNYAGKDVPIIELYFTALQFTEENDLKVRLLLFFKRSASTDIMRAMIVPEQRGRMNQLFAELAKQLMGG